MSHTTENKKKSAFRNELHTLKKEEIGIPEWAKPLKKEEIGIPEWAKPLK